MLGMGGGTRKRGRPRARWLADIKDVTKCTLTELCGSARDRDAWRKMIMAITRSRTRLDGTRLQDYTLVLHFRVKEKFAGGKFREIPCTVDIYFAGG